MKRYPDDLDAATLFAEAVMDTMPWEYYTEDRRPKAVTEELVKALEFVIAKDPQHRARTTFIFMLSRQVLTLSAPCQAPSDWERLRQAPDTWSICRHTSTCE
jgi:hypothetical protein